MMVVAGPRFIQRRTALDDEDTAQQPGIGQIGKTVINRLMRYTRQNDRYPGKNRGSAGMRIGTDRVEHCHTLARYPKRSITDQKH